jgi:hypothetical protein
LASELLSTRGVQRTSSGERVDGVKHVDSRATGSSHIERPNNRAFGSWTSIGRNENVVVHVTTTYVVEAQVDWFRRSVPTVHVQFDALFPPNGEMSRGICELTLE